MELRAAVGPVGVWSREFRNTDPAMAGVLRDAAAELEELGFGALWIGGSPDVTIAEPVLDATSRLVVATGILSVWQQPAADTAAKVARLTSGDRFVLGLGVSHEYSVPQYSKPYSTMVDYLDALDEATPPVAPAQRVLAALGPKMLRLSTERAAGAHPYMIPLGHTADARNLLGKDPLLAPEINVVLKTDPTVARAAARVHVRPYLENMPNYTNNLRRYGFTDDDIRNGGSDRLIDALYLWGDDDHIRDRAAEYHAAGADHLAVQVVRTHPDANPPLPEYRRLAAALIA